MVKGFNESEMREERYQAILAAYGADPKRWPEAERAAAMQFAASADPAAGREEAALDALLNVYAGVATSADNEAAMARILSTLPRNAPAMARIIPLRPVGRRVERPTRGVAATWFEGRKMMAAGFAFMALAGLAIGFTQGGVGLTTADASDELMVSYALAEG